MSQVKVVNGDLYIIFMEMKDDIFVSYKLDNGAEMDFSYDKLAQIILPNFEMQLGRGYLSDVPIELVGTQMNDEKLTLSIKIIEDVINITLDCSSLKGKI